MKDRKESERVCERQRENERKRKREHVNVCGVHNIQSLELVENKTGNLSSLIELHYWSSSCESPQPLALSQTLRSRMGTGEVARQVLEGAQTGPDKRPPSNKDKRLVLRLLEPALCQQCRVLLA